MNVTLEFHMARFFVLATSILLTLLPASAQVAQDLLDARSRDVLISALDGETAKKHVEMISSFHRVQASPGYDSASAYVLAQLRKYGFSAEDATVETYPSDGTTQYLTWQSPSGWDVTDAELSCVEPSAEKLVSYAETPMSLMTYSNPGDVTAECVWVGRGTSEDDYKGKNVKGKFALATGYGGDVHRLAVVKYGAKGVVCYLDDSRAADHPDMVQYTGIWPRTEELKKVTFGFNISNKQGTKLRDLCVAGKKVVLHGVVHGKGLYAGSMKVVSAVVRGREKPGDELVFIAHLDHPKYSANDNASGSGALLDIARTFKAAIQDGSLKRPRKSFRFLWVPEWYGTMAYLQAHPEFKGPKLGGTVLAAVDMDMVGENQGLLRSRLKITLTPNSVPSILNDVMENMAQMTDRLNIASPGGSGSAFTYDMVPYGGGSDHMMLLDRKIPASMLSHSDWTHHTSEDTPEKVDPLELKRCELIAAGAMWYLGNMSTQQASELVELSRATTGLRLGILGQYMNQRLDTAKIIQLPTEWCYVDGITYYTVKREIDAGLSIATFNDNDYARDRVAGLSPHIRHRFAYLYDLSKVITQKDGYAADFPPPLDNPIDSTVPVRLATGPLDFRLPESRLPAARAQWYADRKELSELARYEIMNLIDGEKTVSEIHGWLLTEFPPMPLEVVRHYLDDLVKLGFVKWATPAGTQ
jgi:aminopeptidase YwaD